MEQGACVNRHMVREWLSDRRHLLEAAQASGTLARTRLDLRDAVEVAFPDFPEAQRDKLLETFDQEIEALCYDLRLATVTVQQQVERIQVPKKKGPNLFLWWVFWLIIAPPIAAYIFR
ncbi:MAG: hypothetical protein ACM31D_04595 [Bacteroidota bacterium]